jgi:dCMP deaminase
MTTLTHKIRWVQRFYQVAATVATWSKDPDVKVGALILSPDGRQVSWGFNGFPSGIEDTEERLADKEQKNKLMLHAEVNALANCPFPTQGCTLIVTRACCRNCALQIIAAGITTVMTPPSPAESSWSVRCDEAIALFQEAGVEWFDLHDLDQYPRFWEDPS